VKSKLIVTLAALLLSGGAQAQAYPVVRMPVPMGRAPNTTADSPAKVDFSVDFNATQTPLAPGEKAAPPPQARQAGSVDRPVDEPVQARAANDYGSRNTGDAPVQGRWPSPRRH
jgi:hypothetical protein